MNESSVGNLSWTKFCHLSGFCNLDTVTVISLYYSCPFPFNLLHFLPLSQLQKHWFTAQFDNLHLHRFCLLRFGVTLHLAALPTLFHQQTPFQRPIPSHGVSPHLRSFPEINTCGSCRRTTQLFALIWILIDEPQLSSLCFPFQTSLTFNCLHRFRALSPSAVLYIQLQPPYSFHMPCPFKLTISVTILALALLSAIFHIYFSVCHILLISYPKSTVQLIPAQFQFNLFCSILLLTSLGFNVGLYLTIRPFT